MPSPTGANQDHCSALVKLLPGNSDVLVAHTSWAPVEVMLRVFKRYSLPYATSA